MTPEELIKVVNDALHMSAFEAQKIMFVGSGFWYSYLSKQVRKKAQEQYSHLLDDIFFSRFPLIQFYTGGEILFIDFDAPGFEELFDRDENPAPCRIFLVEDLIGVNLGTWERVVSPYLKGTAVPITIVSGLTDDES